MVQNQHAKQLSKIYTVYGCEYNAMQSAGSLYHPFLASIQRWLNAKTWY